MKETITGRVGRIISASVNALVDAVENAAPEAVMEEAIREVDGVIDEVRAELGRVIARKHLANTRLMDENAKHDSLSEKIGIAVEQARDDLAEAAIAAQLDIEAQIPVLESTITECGAQEKELEGFVRALQAKQREMRDELRRFRESQKEAAVMSSESAAASGSANVGARMEKAGATFDRVMEKASGIAADTSSVSRESAAQLAELDDMAHKNRVQERLAAVKRGMNSKGE